MTANTKSPDAESSASQSNQNEVVSFNGAASGHEQSASSASAVNLDLFGQPASSVPLPVVLNGEKRKRKPTKPKGYAARPGSGPKGETCKTCARLMRHRMSKTYLKCGLVKATHGPGTDIRAKSPACQFWKAEDSLQ